MKYEGDSEPVMLVSELVVKEWDDDDDDKDDDDDVAGRCSVFVLLVTYLR